MSLPEDQSLNCRNIMFLSKVLNWRPGAKIKFIKEATYIYIYQGSYIYIYILKT